MFLAKRDIVRPTRNGKNKTADGDDKAAKTSETECQADHPNLTSISRSAQSTLNGMKMYAVNSPKSERCPYVDEEMIGHRHINACRYERRI